MSLVKKLLLKKIESHNSNRNLRSLMSKREIKTFQFLLRNFYNYQFNFENKTKVLDVGCADKFLEKSFLEKNISYTGIDIVDCDLNKDKINFPDNTFDFIVCLALVEHISNTENMFNEFNRVLKKKGILYITTPNWIYSSDIFYDDPTHVKPYTPKSLESIMKLYNFYNIRTFPGLRCKPKWFYTGRNRFFKGRYLLPFSGNNNFVPNFLKGKAKSIIAIGTK
jgi:2-polyprenyl-3-methyl-5-hydroxy-6-metoxy-1,4-benzoquinol methylase